MKCTPVPAARPKQMTMESCSLQNNTKTIAHTHTKSSKRKNPFANNRNSIRCFECHYFEIYFDFPSLSLSSFGHFYSNLVKWHCIRLFTTRLWCYHFYLFAVCSQSFLSSENIINLKLFIPFDSGICSLLSISRLCVEPLALENAALNTKALLFILVRYFSVYIFFVAIYRLTGLVDTEVAVWSRCRLVVSYVAGLTKIPLSIVRPV